MKPRVARGVTLVELMVAVAIGSLIMLAIGSVYVGNRQTYRTSEAVSRLQEEARFATLQLRNAVQQAGYIGRLDSATLVNGSKGSGSDLPDISGDCDAGWYINLDRPLESPDTSVDNPYASTCLNGSSNFRRRLLEGSDLLVVRRTDSATMTDADVTAISNSGRIFLRADVRRGELFKGGAGLPQGYDSDTVENRVFIAEMFYLSPDDIGDGIPVLRRLYLATHGGAPALRSERVARYVEDFQVQFGEDMNGDGNADRFVEPADATPEQAVSVRVWLLFRAETLEMDYTAPATFTVGEHVYTTPAGTEHFRRLLITQTYTLRNF